MNKYNNKLTLIFEGADGSGKTKLINKLKLFSSTKLIDIVDRGFISDRVYATKFDRIDYNGVPVELYCSYWEYWHKTNRETVIILCEADAITLYDRCLDKKDTIVKDKSKKEVIDELKEDRQNFKIVSDYICHKYNFKLLVLDTTKFEYNCIEQIEEFIDEYRI